MKTLLIILFFISSLVHGQTNAILYLTIGESNLVRGDCNPSEYVSAPSTSFWYRHGDNSLQPLAYPDGEGNHRGCSMNPKFAKRVKELTGQDVIVLPCGTGGTTVGGWQKGIYLYAEALQMWNDAIAYCASHNIILTHKFVQWYQGGNDVTHLETDGYYYYLNKLVNDIQADFGAEKVFATRIGYDPNFAPAFETEKVMKADKIYNFNNPYFILTTDAPATFTKPDGTIQDDLVHNTLKGQNIIAEAWAQALAYYLQTGQKIAVAEPVAALQSVTSGYINLNPNWAFEFNGNIADTNQNVTGRHGDRGATTSHLYDNGSLLFAGSNYVETSRPFSQSEFTITMRFTCSGQGTQTLFSAGEGSANKVALEINGANSYVTVNIGGAGFYVLTNDIDWHTYHLLKLQQMAGMATLFVDGVQKIQQPSTLPILVNFIGGGSTYNTDLTGAIDYFRTVAGAVGLPVHFKYFKASNL